MAAAGVDVDPSGTRCSRIDHPARNPITVIVAMRAIQLLSS